MTATTRRDVEFVAGPADRGEVCRAWLYLPDTADRRPVVVMAHGLGGIRDMRLPAFAERFTAAGYACLVFDYRHFGASDGAPRQLLDIGRQLDDWSAAVDFARDRPEVDGSRIVLWGTSFSGGHVMAVAVREPGPVAVIAQCPFTDGVASLRALQPRSAAKVTALAVADLAAVARRCAPVMVALAGPPGSAALMTAPDALPGYLALVPAGSEHLNEVAARVGLRIPFYRPGRHLAQVRCPILVCVCEKDSVAPAKATERYARNAATAEVREYPYGHFDIYLGSPFERVVADQIAFLRRHVPVPEDLGGTDGTREL